MIHAVLIFNTSGIPRLTKFYTPLHQSSQTVIQKIFSLISIRPPGLCNFLDAPELEAFLGPKDDSEERWRVVYRNYATLYFVFVVDGAESELGILDLIQVFVEALDRAFENVCELDLVFHFDEVHHILAEIIQGGLVLETNVDEISSSDNILFLSDTDTPPSKDGIEGTKGVVRISESTRFGDRGGRCSERGVADTPWVADGQANGCERDDSFTKWGRICMHP
ncbi:Adaptor protein complex sigma subunit [Chiua virens]|nr:Adaptor protein complex sigma subunit [Chiua virens]